MNGLLYALQNTKKTIYVADKVYYTMLKHLPYSYILVLLELYNQQSIPSNWKQSLIVPIRKPGKDPCFLV